MNRPKVELKDPTDIGYRAVIEREMGIYTIEIERGVMWDDGHPIWVWAAGPSLRLFRRSAERCARKKLRRHMDGRAEGKPTIIDAAELRAEEWAKTVKRSCGRLLPSSTKPERIVAPPLQSKEDR